MHQRRSARVSTCKAIFNPHPGNDTGGATADQMPGPLECFRKSVKRFSGKKHGKTECFRKSVPRFSGKKHGLAKS